MLDDREVGVVAEDVVEHVVALRRGCCDDAGREGGVLIGDVGVGREALPACEVA